MFYPGIYRSNCLRILFLFVILATTVSRGSGASTLSDPQWDMANHFYAQKQYDSAAYYYEKLAAEHSPNSSLYYNLGNTYFRMQQTGLAILYYEKALQLRPQDQWTRDNLRLAQSRILNPIPEATPIFFVQWWHQALEAFSPNTWAWLCFLAFTGLITLLYIGRRPDRKLPHSGRWVSLAVACLLLFSSMAYFSNREARADQQAIVLIQASNLQDAPSPRGRILLPLPEGTLVRIAGDQDDYFLVRLPNGKTGWILKDAVGKI